MVANLPRIPDFTFPAMMPANDRFRNSTNAITRGLLGAPRNPQAAMQSSRKRITFGDDEPSGSHQAQQSVALTSYMAGNSAFQSLLFDSNNNNGAPSAKVENDSPRNGVRKDVKLISDAAETEELFGTQIAVNIASIAIFTRIRVAQQELLAVTAFKYCRITV